MKGIVFIDSEEIGSADFEVIDESMGAIQGKLKPIADYNKYKQQIQELFEKKGIASLDDFNFKIILDDNTVLRPEGGIGITDSQDFDGILVECAGLDENVIEKMSGGKGNDLQ